MAVTWPGMQNGQIPLSAMIDVVGDGAEGHYLNPTAAYFFKRMQKDMLADLGKTIGTREAYRSLKTQQWYAGPNSPLDADVARAVPGQSKHGWGRANDITGYNDPDIWAWLQKNAWKYGWDWAEGKASNEKWHWVFIWSLDTPVDWSYFDNADATAAKEPEIEYPNEGAFYRIGSGEGVGTVYSQESPGYPLYALSGGEWDAFGSNDNRYADMDAQIIQGLLRKVGAYKTDDRGARIPSTDHWTGFEVYQP